MLQYSFMCYYHSTIGNVLFELTSVNDFPLEEVPISATGQSLDSFYVTESPLSVTNIAEMAMFYLKLTSLEDFPLEDGPISPTGQFKQSLDSF